LIPKKSKVIVEITANEMQQDINLVRDITSFYWSRVRKNLSGLKFPVMNIKGLGTMTIRPIKLQRANDEYKGILKHMNPKYFQSFGRIKNLESKIERIDKMYSMLEECKLKKEAVKTRRNEQNKNPLE